MIKIGSQFDKAIAKIKIAPFSWLAVYIIGVA